MGYIIKREFAHERYIPRTPEQIEQDRLNGINSRSNKRLSLRQTAKYLHIKERLMLNILHNNCYIYKDRSGVWFPCSQNKHYFDIIEITRNGHRIYQTLVKPQGILKIKELMGLN